MQLMAHLAFFSLFPSPTTCPLSKSRSINFISSLSLLLACHFPLSSVVGTLYRPPWPLPTFLTKKLLPFLSFSLTSLLLLLSSSCDDVKSSHGSSLYADMPGFHSPSFITGDGLLSDLLLTINDNCLFVYTVGFEMNLVSSSNRKLNKYPPLLYKLTKTRRIFPSFNQRFRRLHLSLQRFSRRMRESFFIDRQHEGFLSKQFPPY